MAAFNFNTKDYLYLDKKPLENGRYKVLIKETSKNTTVAGGESILITLEVLDHKYLGRKIIDRFNIINDNPHSVEKANSKMFEMLQAVNITAITDTNQLVNKKMIVEIGINKNGNNNDVYHYFQL